MSATSGIGPSPELTSKFADAIESKSIRFLKVSIHNESLVHDLSIPISGSFQNDLTLLQTEQILQSNSPAFILAKLDQPATDWLAIFYVPDAAKIRDKMLYAATRTNLLRSLGSTLFTDSIFATGKEDLTPEAYAAHLSHIAAPKPLSAREQEMADLRVAENVTATYEGSRARASHVGAGVVLNWSPDVEEAIARLGKGDSSAILIITIDPGSETLTLHSNTELAIQDLSMAFPASEPCYALFACPPASLSMSKRLIVFIYSCPSNSSIKYRMLYSSASMSTYQGAKAILTSASPSAILAPRKVETSDPRELDESYLRSELDMSWFGSPVDAGGGSAEKKPFAKPKGPGRRR